MSDHAQRFLLEEADVRGELVRLQVSYQQIMEQHQYPKHIQRLLGEVLVVAVLLTSTLKFKGELTIQLQGEGVVKLLVAKCSDDLHIRGLAQWDEQASSAEIEQAMGAGKLLISVQPQQSASYHQSIVPLNQRSVAKALEVYFQQSEQLTTRLWLDVDDQQASSLLLQMMPGVDSVDRERFWEHAVVLADTLRPGELLKNDNMQILDKLYREENLRIFHERPVAFRCTCSVEKMQQAILTLSEEEAKVLLKEEKKIEVACEFCLQTYEFDEIDVAHIFATKKDQSLH